MEGLRSEQDVFQHLELEWVAPQDREVEARHQTQDQPDQVEDGELSEQDPEQDEAMRLAAKWEHEQGYQTE